MAVPLMPVPNFVIFGIIVITADTAILTIPVVADGDAGEHELCGLGRGGIGTPINGPSHLLARPTQSVALVPDRKALRRYHGEVEVHEEGIPIRRVENDLMPQLCPQHRGAGFKRCRAIETGARRRIEIDRRGPFAIDDGQWAVGRCSRGGQLVHEGEERAGSVVWGSAEDVVDTCDVGEVTILVDFGGGHDTPLANEFHADARVRLQSGGVAGSCPSNSGGESELSDGESNGCSHFDVPVCVLFSQRRAWRSSRHRSKASSVAQSRHGIFIITEREAIESPCV